MIKIELLEGYYKRVNRDAERNISIIMEFN